MALIVVTGGIGCGKSTLLKEFAGFGCRVADADDVSHDLYRKGAPAYEAMASRWGHSVLEENGEIDRRRVASIVFRDSSERTWLENLLHPLIRGEIDRLAQEGPLFCAIPLFYESGWAGHGEVVISSWCDTETQMERLLARGWSREDIAGRLAAQIPKDEKLRRADYGVITSCSWELLRKQCRLVCTEVLDRLGNA